MEVFLLSGKKNFAYLRFEHTDANLFDATAKFSLRELFLSQNTQRTIGSNTSTRIFRLGDTESSANIFQSRPAAFSVVFVAN